MFKANKEGDEQPPGCTWHLRVSPLPNFCESWDVIEYWSFYELCYISQLNFRQTRRVLGDERSCTSMSAWWLRSRLYTKQVWIWLIWHKCRWAYVIMNCLSCVVFRRHSGFFLFCFFQMSFANIFVSLVGLGQKYTNVSIFGNKKYPFFGIPNYQFD